MRTFAGDDRGKRCAGAVAAALAVMTLVCLSPSVATAQPTDSTSRAASSADEHTPLAVVPAVVVAAVWLWRARIAAVSAKNHVLAPSIERATTVGGRAAAFDLDLQGKGDRR